MNRACKLCNNFHIEDLQSWRKLFQPDSYCSETGNDRPGSLRIDGMAAYLRAVNN